MQSTETEELGPSLNFPQLLGAWRKTLLSRALSPLHNSAKCLVPAHGEEDGNGKAAFRNILPACKVTCLLNRRIKKLELVCCF